MTIEQELKMAIKHAHKAVYSFYKLRDHCAANSDSLRQTYKAYLTDHFVGDIDAFVSDLERDLKTIEIEKQRGK